MKVRINLSFVTLLIGVTMALAFTPAAKVAKTGELWFDYTSTSQTSTELQKPSNYTLHNGDGSVPSCNSGLKRCAIEGYEDPNNMGKPTSASAASPVAIRQKP